MFYIVGLLIAFASIVTSIMHLKQSIFTYFDFVALAVVFGGSSSVALIILPWEYSQDIWRAVKGLLSPIEKNQKSLIIECLTYIYTRERGAQTPVSTTGLAGDILRDGDELISLGFKSEKIENILLERVHQKASTYQSISHAIRSLAKYPPAFGLVGTVLGLVSLMRSVADGAPSAEIGVRMAVALVATLYGLLLSNLVVNPAGESLLKIATEEKKQAELAVQAILLAAERTSLLESQEVLNSFVPKHDRVNVIAQLQNPTEERMAA